MARTLQMLGLPPQEERRAGDAAGSMARVLAFFLSQLRHLPEAAEPRYWGYVDIIQGNDCHFHNYRTNRIKMLYRKVGSGGWSLEK